jgi:hypothetical protein
MLNAAREPEVTGEGDAFGETVLSEPSEGDGTGAALGFEVHATSTIRAARHAKRVGTPRPIICRF